MISNVSQPPINHLCLDPSALLQVTDLYWMVSNVNRDATRNWKQPDKPDGMNPDLHITLFRWAVH